MDSDEFDTEILLEGDLSAEVIKDDALVEQNSFSSKSEDDGSVVQPPKARPSRRKSCAATKTGSSNRGRGKASAKARSFSRSTRKRGRGSKASTSATTRTGQRQEEREAFTSREEKLKCKIDNLSEEMAKKLLLQCAISDAGISLMVLEGQPDPENPPPPIADQPDWCVCSNCRDMPTAVERKCCRKSRENCLRDAPGFDVVVLDRQVLRVSMALRNDILAAENVQPDASLEDTNRSFRHAAYRQFILMHHGKLGVGNRRVIPSCCVWKIRDTFPDPNNDFKGWLPSLDFE